MLLLIVYRKVRGNAVEKVLALFHAFNRHTLDRFNRKFHSRCYRGSFTHPHSHLVL